MATVTPEKPQPFNRDESQRQVRHPLERLRGYIRAYVTAEGLAVFALYVMLWFWIGLLLDYGVFKTFTVDWVQELPWAFRAVVLVGLTAGLIAVVVLKVVLRLLREFRDSALALVLERRFPHLLGDRLITAVELADPRMADRYGYSQAMVDQTIRDAAAQVDKVPIREAFNWRRLRRAGLWVLALTLGIYLLVGAGYCLWTRASADTFPVRFNNVAAIWFERNILLQDTIWPRRAHLELVNFPESGDLHIGQNAPPPSLHVRAIKWIIADRGAPEGWRAMTWADLGRKSIGVDAPSDVLPADWQNQTLDWIELQLDKDQAHATVSADTYLKVRTVLEQLQEKAEQPSMERRFRMLEIPAVVTVYYQGETVKSEQTLKKQNDNEYSGVLSDLRESIRFTVNGADYYTPYRFITVVPPPTLFELTHEEERPAYLYHRPPANQPLLLKGRKQHFASRPISLSGSLSRIDVPAGTDVILRGTPSKPLNEQDGVILRAQQGSAPVDVPVQVGRNPDGTVTSFEIRFNNVTATHDFMVVMTDPDNVIGERRVMIKPYEDTPPDVDVLVEIIRKSNQGYLVTPSARIPFSGRVRDDNGLVSVQYAYKLTAQDAGAVIALPPIVSTFQFAPRGLLADVAILANLAWARQVSAAVVEQSNKKPKMVDVTTFPLRLREKDGDGVPADQLDATLREEPKHTLVRDHSFEYVEEFREDRPGDDFDVAKLNLKVSDDRIAQPRYQMLLWVVATDTNVESKTGPGVGESKEKLTFLIIPENDLLVEIGKEEEGLHVKLDDTFNKISDGRDKVKQVGEDLPTLKPEEFSPKATRLDEVQETVGKGWDFTREVYQDYVRILKELKFNRVHPKIVEKVEHQICEPLDGVINQEFDRADRALKDYNKAIRDQIDRMKAARAEERAALAKKAAEELKPAAQAANQRMDELVEKLREIIANMGEITNLNQLIATLVEIEKTERKASAHWKQVYEKIAADLLDKAAGTER
jgi:hypothetical protein